MRTQSPTLDRLALLAAAAIAAAAIAGCGSDDDESDAGGEEAAALAPVEDFYAGIAEGDGETACATLSEEGRAELEGEATGLPPGTTCEEAIDQIVGLFSEETLQAISDVEPSVAEIGETTATVEATSFNQQSEGTGAELEEETIEIEVVKEDDEWKIASFPSS